MIGTEVRFQAQTGDHDIAKGTSLYAWADPRTGDIVPGSVIFVSQGAVHPEDTSDRVHLWPVADLKQTDRSTKNASLARPARLATHSANRLIRAAPGLCQAEGA